MVKKIINAKVLDVDTGTYTLSSVYVDEGKVSQIIKQDSMIEEDADLDLSGKFLSPGFIDTHSHLVMYSNFRRQLNCSPENVTSIEDIISQFKERKDEILRDGWLRGYGYNEF